jgi:type III pantothenate kinase
VTSLLIDAGNTRIKWALERDNALEQSGHSVHRGRAVEEVVKPIAVLAARPERVIVSNVGGAELGEALRKVTAERFGLAAEFAVVQREAFGLRIAYTDPKRLGVDRWLAMLGARANHEGALLVVGVGTAMTIDGVDANGSHLGGLIVPGLETMKASLLAGTAGIRDAGDGRAAEIFASDTGAAVSSGAAHALAALIERAAAELARRTREQGQVVLTGGDAETIRSLISVAGIVDPDLVLRGLVVYARAR